MPQLGQKLHEMGLCASRVLSPASGDAAGSAKHEEHL